MPTWWAIRIESSLEQLEEREGINLKVKAA
jgi:hypothetical protein